MGNPCELLPCIQWYESFCAVRALRRSYGLKQRVGNGEERVDLSARRELNLGHPPASSIVCVARSSVQEASPLHFPPVFLDHGFCAGHAPAHKPSYRCVKERSSQGLAISYQDIPDDGTFQPDAHALGDLHPSSSSCLLSLQVLEGL